MRNRPTTPTPIRLGAIISESLAKTNAQAPAATKQAVMDMIRAALQSEVGKRGRSLIIDDELQERMAHVAEWLTSDTRTFLILCGRCGNGKTTTMRAIASVVSALGCSTSMPTMREEHAMELYRSMKYAHLDWQSACHAPLLGIDDLGEEPTELLSYGNYQRPLTELLQIRYDLQLPTVVTTNLTPPQISEKYGERIADRLTESALVVPFLSPSYRGMGTCASPAAEASVQPSSEHTTEPTPDPTTDPTAEQPSAPTPEPSSALPLDSH